MPIIVGLRFRNVDRKVISNISNQRNPRNYLRVLERGEADEAELK